MFPLASHYRCQSTTRLLCSYLIALALIVHPSIQLPDAHVADKRDEPTGPFGTFPRPRDPFRFLPCTKSTSPPYLNDPHADQTWAAEFDPNPANWMWGSSRNSSDNGSYIGRGLYLCGYLDVPMDYTSKLDTRIVRLSVAKYQISGAGNKSARTIVVNPGGPGESGVFDVLVEGESTTERLSRGKYDLLGWDPRGVNGSQPRASCYPYDVDRDRWFQLVSRDYKESPAPMVQLEIADAMNYATLASCKERLGDFPQFMTTAFVSRDVESIRKALNEPELTAYMQSSGTDIAQTYVNMFPNSVGRVIMDGVDATKELRSITGFATSSLDDVTDVWNTGFLGECVNAGPDHCALARPIDGKPVTLKSLQERMDKLLASLVHRPDTAYLAQSGPSLVLYKSVNMAIYGSLGAVVTWPFIANLLAQLEAGNSTAMANYFDGSWVIQPQYGPATVAAVAGAPPSTTESGLIIICSDAYDSPPPAEGLAFWERLWHNVTDKAIFGASFNFFGSFQCQNFVKFFPRVAEVYRGPMNKTLKNPVLLVSSLHDPITPVRIGREALATMGSRNARLVVQEGYGHTSRSMPSRCTNELLAQYMIDGMVPDEPETLCPADEKPYIYT